MDNETSLLHNGSAPLCHLRTPKSRFINRARTFIYRAFYWPRQFKYPLAGAWRDQFAFELTGSDSQHKSLISQQCRLGVFFCLSPFIIPPLRRL